jgi:hypothetical protein
MTHRYWTLGLLAVVAGGLIARPAVATDQDTFNKLIAKVATTVVFGQKLIPKVACACHDGSVDEGKAGFVETVGVGGTIKCGIPGFDATGTVQVVGECNPFEVLGR